MLLAGAGRKGVYPEGDEGPGGRFPSPRRQGARQQHNILQQVQCTVTH